MSAHVRSSRLLTIAAGLLLLAASSAFAQRGPGGPMQGGPGRMPPGGPMGPGGPGGGPMGIQMLLGQLDLTDQQKTDIKAIYAAQREADQPVRDQMRTAQQQLNAAVFADAPDEGAVATAVAQVTTLQKQVFESEIGVQQKVAAVLTAEQRQQLLKLMSRGPRGPQPPLQQ